MRTAANSHMATAVSDLQRVATEASAMQRWKWLLGAVEKRLQWEEGRGAGRNEEARKDLPMAQALITWGMHPYEENSQTPQSSVAGHSCRGEGLTASHGGARKAGAV